MALPIIGHDRSRGLVRKILDTLLGPEVELYPGTLVPGIDHREGMAPEEMHVSKRLWNATVGHDDGDLVECLWKQRPEVPVILRTAKAGAGIALDGVIEVRESQRIAEEKNRSIVSDDVPISFLGIELQSRPADIAFGIGRPTFPG